MLQSCTRCASASVLCVCYPLGPMTSLSSHSVMQSGTEARSVAKSLCAWACVCLPCLFSCVRVIMLPSSAKPFSKFSRICYQGGGNGGGGVEKKIKLQRGKLFHCQH